MALDVMILEESGHYRYREWYDYKLKWDPSEYGGIEDINLPAEQLWLPDIALYNSAEGFFAVSIMTKAKVRYDGHVIWNPPAIFRSSCQIDITYFPFDSQNCILKFGSWTFGTKLDLRHINDTQGTIERGTDLSEYYQNVEWDIMQASAIRNVIKYECCPNDFYPDVTFHFKLRRKPLFYTVNLILPCVGITFFSFLVFYLPSDSGEKVTLTISILVSLIFFLSVLIETIPSTSLAMPLLGKYLVFTMCLITLSVCATVCVLNIHFRTPSTHSMSPWIKRLCMDVLPKYLFMSVPQYQSQQASILPEQLIYLHNQAYANQAVTIPGHPSSGQQQANNVTVKQKQDTSKSCCPTTLINGLSSNDLAAGHHFHASQADQAQRRGGASGGASDQQPMQLNAAELMSSGALQTPRPATFLPYLQSEAARRLRVQRSRSSDRDNRSTSDNQQTNSATTSTNNGGRSNCDTSVRGQQARGGNASVGESAAGPSSSGASVRQSRVVERPAKSKGSSTRPFWRLFKATKSDDSHDQVSHSKDQPARSRSTSSSSSSSTVGGADEDDEYKHHRHFQARASICSNNLWRIGPTRRCSLAVQTVNYPSYYRPLAQLQHHSGSGIPGGGGPLSTISGCLPPIPAHYHTHGEESSTSSDGTSVPAIGTLIGASAANILHPSRQVYDLSQRPVVAAREMEPLTSGGFVRSAAQGPYPVEALPPRQLATPSDHQSYQSDGAQPTPPPPLPPLDFNLETGDRSMASLLRMQQYHRQPPPPPLPSRNPSSSNENWGPPASPMDNVISSRNMAQMERDSSTSTSNTTATAHYRQAMPQAMQPVHQYLSMARGPPQQQQQHMTRPLEGSQSSRINVSGGYYSGDDKHQRVVSSGNQSFGGADYPIAQYLDIGAQSMPRSRSTDQRLSDMPRDVSTNSLFACAQSGVNQMRQPVYQIGMHQNALLGVQSAAMQMESRQPSQQQQQQCHQLQQSIGRQLGQAYIQRLQRQPTIYSLHQSRLLPAFVQRATPSHDLGQQQQQQQRRLLANPGDECQLQNYPEPSIDMLRRSKSQTSLNKRTRTGCPSRDCMGMNACGSGAMLANQHNTMRREPTNSLSRPQSEMRGRFNSTGCRQQCEYDARNRPAPSCCGPANRCDDVGDRGVLSHCTAAAGGLMSARTISNANKARKNYSNKGDTNGCRCSAPDRSIGAVNAPSQQRAVAQMSTLSMLKLIDEVDKAIQNAMFIAQHIDNLDEFESVKENWKYIAMVIDRIFLIIFLFACIFGTVAIFALVPWSYYLNEKPIDLQLTRLMALNLTSGEAVTQGCHEF